MARFPTGAVIVGGSAAGLAAADGLREGGYAGSIIVLDEEADPGFDRPMLSKALIGEAAGTGPNRLRGPEQLAGKDITVLGYHRAMGLDVDRRLVVTNWGEAIPWEHLVIATGVDGIRLRTTAGNALPALRNRDDLGRVRRLFDSGRPVTCVGAGFVGLEVAAGLRGRGVDITLISDGELPLEPCLGRDVAGWLVGLHRAHGVRFELGTAVTSVEEAGDGYLVGLGDGRRLPAETVLAAVGTTPNTDWLLGSGVELSRGVLVDAAGRSNVPGVWAAGDVATTVEAGTGAHHRFEHWTHAVEQGRHVGLNIARGQAAPFEGVPYFWTEGYGHTLHVLGTHRPGDQVTVVEGSLEAGAFVAVHADGDDLHAVSISGHPAAIRTYKKLLKAGAGHAARS
ncbi:NAD(P)/FAD-dependent oxidoreductase [Nonomuraea wenchangensis]|uniref:NADPH-dependent 2,4-dienoyl-CoA reductase, sulfur reductase n=1 Tax=Nonomuraea wenchangensis TaxID=568860 RepID=A0A1I0L0P2_9ACTN|nr:FAD-dependent oxidoreductase [Nonomuraea wenchangensis]SEU32808.1 NADPH-dependent 2,4-dienoyl-CoA reductase, sulfur reductase [Nonomuraea wenchangensis]